METVRPLTQGRINYLMRREAALRETLTKIDLALAATEYRLPGHQDQITEARRLVRDALADNESGTGSSQRPESGGNRV